MATASPNEVWTAKALFAQEAAVAPWAVLVPLVAFGWFTGSTFSLGLALVAAGVLFVYRQHVCSCSSACS